MRREMYYQQFNINQLTPEGWLYRQLKTQAEGLCGNLDKVWPDVRDSKWIGGDREGWERVPYWLDGFIPLAWLLDDADMQKRARKYIDGILAIQKQDGWICPCEVEERPTYDVWAAFLICKVLVVYYECTEDTRIEQTVYDVLKCLYRHSEVHTLFGWAAARWFECLIPLGWLYKRRPEKWMEDFATLLQVQGFDYKTLVERWPYKKPQEFGRWNFQSHVVNLAMSLKSEVLNDAFWGEEYGDFAEKAFDTLMKYHGMPIGHFSGDECLAGKKPLSGTELCGIVEAMYSYEWILQTTGRDIWADRLEMLAFNALPATTSADMWTHQYDQMVNQIACVKFPVEQVPFLTNSRESHLFGLEPNYGCCTANFGQGWPKLASSVFLRSERGLAIGAILPSSVSMSVGEAHVVCRIETDYPFEDGYRIVIQTDRPATFELSLRIPEEAKDTTIDGKAFAGNRYVVSKEWADTQTIDIRFRFEAVRKQQYEDMYYVKRGPLIFALPIEAQWEKREYTKDGVERCYPYCDYELYPKTAWNYAFTDAAFVYEKNSVAERPFDAKKPPVCLHTKLSPVEWYSEYQRAAEKPISFVPVAEEVEVDLVPYGCTDLRMTVMPVAKKE